MNVMYHNAFDVDAASSEGSYDRARGGQIEIKLTIPSETLTANGACGGTITTKEMKVTILLDIEKLPLVNVAGYYIEEEQTGPGTLGPGYPDDPIVIKIDEKFS